MLLCSMLWSSSTLGGHREKANMRHPLQAKEAATSEPLAFTMQQHWLPRRFKHAMLSNPWFFTSPSVLNTGQPSGRSVNPAPVVLLCIREQTHASRSHRIQAPPRFDHRSHRQKTILAGSAFWSLGTSP